MRRTLAVTTALLLSLSFTPPAIASCPPLTPEQIARQTDDSATPAGTKRLTAIEAYAGKVYCNDRSTRPTRLLCSGGPGGKLAVADVKKVAGVLNSSFQYRSDYVRTGIGDLWEGDTTCGDCEDYVLGLAHMLNAAGVGGKFMRLIIWSPSVGSAHATLVVETADAGEVEFGVGEASRPYDPNLGDRFGSMRFDGRRVWSPEPGYAVVRQEYIYRK